VAARTSSQSNLQAKWFWKHEIVVTKVISQFSMYPNFHGTQWFC